MISLFLGGHHGPFSGFNISALDLRLQSAVVKRTAVKSEASGWWQEALVCCKRRDYGPLTRRSGVRGEGEEREEMGISEDVRRQRWIKFIMT